MQVAELIGISRQCMGSIEVPNMIKATSLDVLFNTTIVLEIEPYVLFKFSPEKEDMDIPSFKMDTPAG